ncbi:MAG: NADPH:quinone reductase [Acidimicrobiales bacterium]|jgi:NADPH2:quinone reductase
MRAAVYEQLGPAQVLHVTELPDPRPGPGEVRVKVRVSGVNPTDWKSRAAGPGKQMPFEYVVPNQDGAGEVDAVGEGVDPRRLGERVWLYLAQWQRQHGTASQWVCLDARQAVPLPTTVGFELGASLGVPALTAAHALMCDGPIEAKTVLVPGGAGAVGHFAIELARRAGARVITTVSSDHKAELARAAGAHVVVNYAEGDTLGAIESAAPNGVDRVVEVAPSNLALDAQVLAPHGVVVLYASTDEDPDLPVRPFMVTNAVVRFMLLYGITDDELDDAVAHVSGALAEGALSTLPFHRFRLDEIADAHRAVENGAVGKVIIDID